MILHVNILLLGRWLLVWCEILIYYAWVRSFLMLNVILPSNGFLGLLIIVKWCRRACWRCLRHHEYRGLAWHFLIFLLLLESSCKLWLGPWSGVYFYIICWNKNMHDFWDYEIEICCWDLEIFGSLLLFRCEIFMKTKLCMIF